MAKIPAQYRPLAHSERSPRPGATLIGPAAPGEALTVSVRLRRRADAPALPDAADLARTRHGEKPYLTRADFAAHYGADPKDIDAVTQFAGSHGLGVQETSIARRTVVLDGTVASMSRAFAVDLGRWKSGDEEYRGREGAIHVPEELADIVEGVFGLDNRRMARPHLRIGTSPGGGKHASPAHARRHDAAAAHATADGGATPAQNITPLTPPEVAKLYGFPAVHATGQTIGIFEFGGGYKPSDLHTYFAGLNLPMPSIESMSVLGQPNAPGSDDYTTETLLDISVAGSVAVGAKIVVYFAPWSEQGWVDVVTQAIHDPIHKPSVISISYGWPENETADGLNWSLAAIQAVNATFKEAAALGVTVFVSSGDSGSGCGVNDHRAHCEYPGADPYVTCCGGTTISNVSGSSFKEDVWNDNGVTGGGISDIFQAPVFPPPAWQSWVSIPANVNDGHKGRGIPDIAGNADPASGYELVQNGAHIGPVGGTSATAPLYAGLAALMNADLGEPVGYLNPNLYAVPAAYVFRDVADGQSNKTGGAPGYEAGAGWDACTGLGSVNGVALQDALQGMGLPIALEPFENKLVAVWKGIERDDRVFMSHFDGTHWAPQTQIAGIESSTGVALAVFRGKLVMVWKGALGDERIFWSLYNGTHWTAQRAIAGIGSSVGPRIAVLNDKLFMAWKGIESDQRIFYNEFDGRRWTRQQYVPGVATSVGPALCTLDGKLYMAWKGKNGDQGLWWSHYTGSGFAPQQQIANVGSSEGPSLAVQGNKILAVWKGEFADQRLWYAHFDGSAWTPQRQISHVASSVGPGLGLLGHELWAAWKGELGDEGIYYAGFNGRAWSTQKRIANVGNSPDMLAAD